MAHLMEVPDGSEHRNIERYTRTPMPPRPPLTLRPGMDGFSSAELAVGEVYGIRWWTVGNITAGVPLTLTGARDKWHEGENAAVCKVGAYRSRICDVPDPECGCGFWAYWTPQAAPLLGGCRAVGVIKGYGRTLIGEKGFRCGKAQIVALTLGQVEQRKAEPLVQGWVPVPASGRPLQHSGMQTYRALGGRPSYIPDPAGVRFEDDWVAQAELENRLIETYQVPVYTSIEVMLARHPPTTDYLPPPMSAEELDRQLAELVQLMRAQAVGFEQLAASLLRLAPKTLQGQDALAELAKRYAAPPKP